jgi:threonine aldolase
VQTNLVFFDLDRMKAVDFEEECRKRGLLGGATATNRVRFVTHYGITAGDIQSTLKICEDVLSA